MKKAVIVIEGPSGAGKDSIMRGLVQKYPNIYKKAPSVTTRAMRDGEVQGMPYIFVDDAQFKKMFESGEIFEHTQRHGTFRGMSLPLIEKILDDGFIALKDADAVGIAALKKVFPDRVLTIFIKAKKAEVEKRLRGRGDSEDDIKIRLADFDNSMKNESNYDFSIENQNLEFTIGKVHQQIQLFVKE